MEIVLKNPLMLLLLLTIPALVVLHYYFFEHNKKKAMKFANFSALKRVTGTHLITKNNTQLALRIITISFFIVAASMPVVWYDGDASITEYVLAIDSSASMVAEDVLPDRLTVAKQSASTFVNNLKAETMVGLISFSGVSLVKLPLTSDKSKIIDSISKIRIESSGGTDIGSALITSINLLSQSEKSKAIILITDGSDTSGSFIEESTRTALDYVTSSHVIVHTIGIGTGKGDPGYVDEISLVAAYDKDTLSMIADTTGGKAFEVKSTAEIAAAFKEINSDVERVMLSFEITNFLFLSGIILLFFEWGLLNTKFRSIP